MQHRNRAQRARSRRRRRRWTNLQRRRRAVEPLEPRRFLSGTQLTISTTDADNKTALLSSDDQPQNNVTETSKETQAESTDTSLPLLTMDKRVLPILSCPGIDPKLCSTTTVSEQSDGEVRFDLLRVLAAEQLQKDSTSLAIDATFSDSLIGTKQFNSFVP